MKKCSCSDCDLEVWEEYNQCVLHCRKSSYSNDFSNGLLREFYDEFLKYIANSVKKSHKYTDNMIAKLVLEELNNDDIIEGKDELKEFILIPTYICFPTRDSRDDFDYLKLLNLFGKIHIEPSD